MWNARLDEAQAGIKISRRDINNLRYADDTALMPESEEELKMKDELLMKVKQSEKIGLKLNIQKLRLWHLVPSLHGKLMTKQWKQWQTLFLGGSKITADGDFSHEMKRCLLLGRKTMTNLDSILKSRDKVCLVKAMVFPVVMYGCESWTVKKAERWTIDAFELWCWRRLLRAPWTARTSNQIGRAHVWTPVT